MIDLDLQRLQKCMPNLPISRAQEVLPHLLYGMTEFQIDQPKRAAAFLAQLGHESNSLKWFEEIADGSAYEGRASLGNTQPGDGKRFKGRGPIQLTGRTNYQRASAALGLPLVDQPHRAADLDVGFRVAGWFWHTHKLNVLADQDSQVSFDVITKTINGGFNGKSDRDRRWGLCRSVLIK